MSSTPRPAPVARSLGVLADRLELSLPAEQRELVVTGVSLDSQTLQPGDLFAALPGRKTHGARHSAQARERGAVAILTDRETYEATQNEGDFFAGLPVLACDDPRGILGEVAAWIYGEPARDLLLIGVTGTNGKTTTTYLLEGGLQAAGYRTGVIGTTGIRIGDQQLPSARTTPEAPDLHAILALMRESGVTAVAMEVSSHALALGRVDGVRFDVGVFTNLSQDHLDFHGTMEAYFAAKATLLTPQRSERGVVGTDDEWGRRLAAGGSIPITTFAMHEQADVMCTGISYEAGAQRLAVSAPDGPHEVLIGLPGDFNAANGLAAWTTLHSLGVPDDVLREGMRKVRVPGRMESIEVGQEFLAIVDYAHSPDSVERVISAVSPWQGGRRIVVLGCGGDRDREKRPVMGRVAASMCDLLVVTDDNPRSEDPAEIRAAMLAGAHEGRADVREIGDRRAAIAFAVSQAKAGDVVLVLGKGHEEGQEAGGVMTPFSDRAEVELALSGAAS